ncbi:MAG: DUF2878 domain-containing protein [Usitatibacter sp.]
MSIALNVVLYQAGWLACVLGAARGAPWLGLAAAVPIVAWHLLRAKRPAPEALLLLAAAIFGAVFETQLVQLDWVRYPLDSWPAGLAPAWMVALWTLFGTTLNVSMRFLRERPWLAVLLGGIAAPAAYYAGARAGALELAVPAAALAAIAAGWALCTPLLLQLGKRLDGYAQP